MDLSSSFAHSDRVQEVPILEMVGYPVVVYPDKELLNYANERGRVVKGASRR